MDGLPFDPSKLSGYKRNQLQQFCKACGIRANAKTAQLIKDLEKYAAQKIKQPSMEPITTDLAHNLSSPSECKLAEKTLMSPENRRDTYCVAKALKVHIKEDQTKKNGVGCHIPVACQPDRKVLKATPNKNWTKIHEKSFNKMDSIDDFLNRRRQKIEENSQSIKSMAKATAAKAKEAVTMMKSTHNTPREVGKGTGGRRDAKSHLPVKRKSSLFQSPCVKEATKPTSVKKPAGDLKRNVSFAFVGVENAPPAKKVKTCNYDAPNSTQHSTLVPKPLLSSVTLSTTNSRVSFPDFRSPLAKASPTKTPKKFDLEASLKRRLSYKPHQGKLKPLTESYVSADSGKKAVKVRQDVKAIKKPISREERRQTAEQNRKSSRRAVMNTRRGMIV